MELVAERTTASGVVMRRTSVGMRRRGPVWLRRTARVGTGAVVLPDGNLGSRRRADVGQHRLHLLVPGTARGLGDHAFSSGNVEGFPMFGAVAQVDPDVILIR